MKFVSFAGVAIAGLAVLVATASSGSAGVRAAFPASARRLPADVRWDVRRNVTASACPTTVPGAFVGGGAQTVAGGNDSAVVDGAANAVCDDYSIVGAGESNKIGNANTAQSSAIVAGYENTVVKSEAFIGAGFHNEILEDNAFVGSGADNGADGPGSFVGAGGDAYATKNYDVGYSDYATGTDSFIGAGDQNTNAALQAFIGSGVLNSIGSSATDSVISGGNDNLATSVYASIGGGSGNKAEGAFAAIPGGADNEAFGAASFAAGYHAFAGHNGSFVWSDDVSGSKLVEDSAANEFVVRASGGVSIYSNETLGTGVSLAAGGGSWASLSDRHAKTAVAQLDDASVLAKVDALPVTAWTYKAERGVRHVGPMAQDFYAAFGVGEDDRHITSIDEDGIALAAIKGLDAKVKAENVALQRENAALRLRLDAADRRNATTAAAFAQRLDALEKRIGN